MCGRYTLATPAELIQEKFGAAGLPALVPRFNIAPSQESVIILAPPDGGRRGSIATWGLEPPWQSRSGGAKRFINARIETVGEKPAFRAAFRRRRCLVPADGFFEWRRRPEGKVPVFFSLLGHEPFAFAGIWSAASSGEGSPGFAILTTRPNAAVETVHDRMPVILDPRSYPEWLGNETLSEGFVAAVAQPFPARRMQAWTVSTFVNNPANDSPTCVVRIES